MIITPFIPPDLLSLNNDSGIDKSEFSIDLFESLSNMGLLRTIKSDDGVVLGLIGAMPRIPGVVEVFLISSKEQRSPKYKIGFAKAIKKVLFDFRSKYRKIQSISYDTKELRKFHRFLGFTEEGLLKKYGMNNEDMIMWGLVCQD